MSREAAVLRKLQFDDGGIDDRRFGRIALALKLMQTGKSKPNTQDLIMKELAYIDVFVKKQAAIAKMCTVQKRRYEKISEDSDRVVGLRIERCTRMQIAQNSSRMDEANQKLAEAKIIRKNKEVYDEIGKRIEVYPSRADSQRRLGEIEQQLAELNDRQQLLEQKLADRRKRFAEINDSILAFKEFMKTEDDELFGKTEKSDEKMDEEIDDLVPMDE